MRAGIGLLSVLLLLLQVRLWVSDDGYREVARLATLISEQTAENVRLDSAQSASGSRGHRAPQGRQRGRGTGPRGPGPDRSRRDVLPVRRDPAHGLIPGGRLTLLHIQFHDAVAEIRMDRPPANALNRELSRDCSRPWRLPAWTVPAPSSSPGGPGCSAAAWTSPSCSPSTAGRWRPSGACSLPSRASWPPVPCR